MTASSNTSNSTLLRRARGRQAAGCRSRGFTLLELIIVMAIAAVVAWLAVNEPRDEWRPEEVLAAPAIAKALGLLKVPSQLEE